MKKIKITVYISSHNYGRYLQEAVESVLRQSIQDWELLLINDGSQDNTKDVLDIYRSDPRIKTFNVKGLGLAGTANLALKRAQGKYIVRLDADDIMDENMLLVLSNYLDNHPQVALVFPDYFLIDESGRVISYEGRQAIYQDNHNFELPPNGACTMIRAQILQGVGGYREDLGAQDGFDLWTKIAKYYKCGNVNLPLFYYRRHGNNLTEDALRILTARRTIKKDMSASELRSYRPITAVIPCRKNYDVFPDLWSKKIAPGQTLLDVAVKTCLNSKIFDKIVVTADNLQVSKALCKYHDKRLKFIERSAQSTLRSCPMAVTLEQIKQKLKLFDHGITIVSYIQAPFTATASLEEAVYTLILNRSDSAFSVKEVQDQLFRRTAHGLLPINPKFRLRSDFDMIYSEAMTSLAALNSNFKTGSLTGQKISCFSISSEEAFFIHTKRDFDVARILMNKYKNEIRRNHSS